MNTEQSGLEVLGGCFGLLALIFAGISAAVIKLSFGRRKVPERRQLNLLMADFCTGVDQSRANVDKIRFLLMKTYSEDAEHEELLAAANSFVPGGRPPFHDEAWLEHKFRDYLWSQGISLPDYGQAKPGVWPPPPNLRG